MMKRPQTLAFLAGLGISSYALPSNGLINYAEAAEVRDTGNDPYCKNSVSMDVHGKGPAWAIASQYLLGHSKGVKETQEGRLKIARALMAPNGEIYQCTLAHAQGEHNPDLVKQIKASDTVYITLEHDKKGNITKWNTKKGKDGIYLDNVSIIRVPRPFLEELSVPKEVAKAAEDGYITFQELGKYFEQLKQKNDEQDTRLKGLEQKLHGVDQQVGTLEGKVRGIKGQPKDCCPKSVSGYTGVLDNGIAQDTGRTEVGRAEVYAPGKRTQNVLGLGWQTIQEDNDAPLSGSGVAARLYLEKSTGDKGALVFDGKHLWYTSLSYEDGQGDVAVTDFDLSGRYDHRLGENTSLTAGVNLDGRSAVFDYAGIGGESSQYAVGPEVGMLWRQSHIGRASLLGSIGFGNVNANADVEGYQKTRDPFTKVKFSGDVETDNTFNVGLFGELEYDAGTRSTQDAGQRPWSDVRFRLGVPVGVKLSDQLNLYGQPEIITSSDADSTVYRGEFGLQFQW